MAVYTVTKLVGAGVDAGPQPGGGFTTIGNWESGAPDNLTTAEKSAATTFLVAEFVQGESLTFVGSGATGKLLETDSTGAGNGSYVVYGITTGNPAASDVVTGGTSGATCVLTSSTPTDVGIIWRGEINAASDGWTGTGAVLTVAGSTPSSTCYKELTAKTGASFRDHANAQTNALAYNSANGCYIAHSSSGQSASVVNATENNFRISRIQMSAQNANINYSCLTTSFGVVDGMLLESDIGQAFINSNALTLSNSALIQLSGGTTAKAMSNSGSFRTMVVANCTLVIPSDKTKGDNMIADSGGSNTWSFVNCAFFGCTNVFTGAPTPTYTTCYSDDASPPTGVTTATYDTSLFAVTTDSGHNYKPVTGSSLVDTGTNYSGTLPAVGTDIVGTARPQGSAYDVGAWELVAAAGGGGALTSAGAATVTGGGSALASGVATSAGAGTAAIAGSSLAAGVLTSAGASTVTFAGSSAAAFESGDFSSAGTSTVSFGGSSLASALVTAAGAATAAFKSAEEEDDDIETKWGDIRRVRSRKLREQIEAEDLMVMNLLREATPAMMERIRGTRH